MPQVNQTERSSVLGKIEAEALIAVIRSDSADQAVETCRALRDGGVVVQEIAMTTPNGAEAVERAASELDDCLIGAGTVLDASTARAVIDAGAAFVFAPNVNPEVIETVRELGRPVVPGALTPTEIAAAVAHGADVVKLFPANYFGPKYIKDIHGPLPGVKITPTGGIHLDNAADWLDAGAFAVGVGTSLIRKNLVREGEWAELTALAEKYASTIRRWKEERRKNGGNSG